MGHAYNKGILLSNGRYIKIIHDDDIYHAEEMEKACIEAKGILTPYNAEDDSGCSCSEKIIPPPEK